VTVEVLGFRKRSPRCAMASGGYVHVPLNPSGAHKVGYGRNTACVRDPYYHLSKDRSYVTYPDAQDTADRLRAIRSVAEDVKKTTKTTWPFYPKPGAAAPAAAPYVSSVGGAYASATPGVVMQPYPYPHPSMQGGYYVHAPPAAALGYAPPHPAATAAPLHLQQHPAMHQPGTTWVASRRLVADDPERSLQFWENSRHTAAARVAEASEKANARVAAALPDRVHSSMWHHVSTQPSESEAASVVEPALQPESESASESELEPEPEPEPEPAQSAGTTVAPAPAVPAAPADSHPPVFSAAVSQAAAMFRTERERHAHSVPHVRRLPQPTLPSCPGNKLMMSLRQALRRDTKLPASAANHLYHPHHHDVTQAHPPAHGVSVCFAAPRVRARVCGCARALCR
jgi:hypothetical protein